MSAALFPKIRAHTFRTSGNVTLDELTNFLTLAESLDTDFTEIALTIFNVILQLRDSP